MTKLLICNNFVTSAVENSEKDAYQLNAATHELFVTCLLASAASNAATFRVQLAEAWFAMSKSTEFGCQSD